MRGTAVSRTLCYYTHRARVVFAAFLRVKRRNCNIFICNQICCDILASNMEAIK